MVTNDRSPTPSEIGVIWSLCESYGSVIDSELRKRFQGETPERAADARQMMLEYLFRHGPRFLDRYVPDRDRHAPSDTIRAQLIGRLLEPRGAFRLWVRAQARWVYRDWVRQARAQGRDLEVRVVADGDEERGWSFERLAVGEPDADLAAALDHARDVVADLMSSLQSDLADDVALFLGAEATSRPHDVYRAWGTSGAHIQKRLRALAPVAQKIVREHEWGC